MTCPFQYSNGFQAPCSGSCQLNISGSCAITQIAVQLNNISKKLNKPNKDEK